MVIYLLINNFCIVQVAFCGVICCVQLYFVKSKSKCGVTQLLHKIFRVLPLHSTVLF